MDETTETVAEVVSDGPNPAAVIAVVAGVGLAILAATAVATVIRYKKIKKIMSDPAEFEQYFAKYIPKN